MTDVKRTGTSAAAAGLASSNSLSLKEAADEMVTVCSISSGTQ